MSVPAIDYTDKDFASLRAAMLRLATQRLPEWTDRSPSDLVMVLIDLFAYCGDIVAYYQDRIASEMFPETATERAGLVDLLRLVGYEFTPAAPARADLRLTFDPAKAAAQNGLVTIAQGSRFRAEVPVHGPIEFIYRGADLTINLASDQVLSDPDPDRALVYYEPLPVEQGVQAAPIPTLGSGTGEPNQTFALPEKQVDLDSVGIEVDEGAGWVRWYRAAAGLPSPDPLAREFRLTVDSSDTPRIVFTNRPPPVGTDNIRAGYRVCVGARGNVAAGQISEAITPIPGLVALTNPVAAAGGSDAEAPDSAIRNAPKMFRSMQRAVTAEDYAALTRATGSVAKVRVCATSWNRVHLYVAPAGDRLTPLSESLRNHLLAYFEDKRPLCTSVDVVGARPAPIDIGCAIAVDERFAPATVLGNVRAAIAGLLAFDTVDFAQTLYLSEVYATVESVSGVIGATVHRFRRADRAEPDIDAQLARSGLPPLARMPDFIRSAISADLQADGRIDVGQFEIPVLGALDVRIQAR